MENQLEHALIAAHAKGDTAQMSGLYHAASRGAETHDEKAFLLTQAYVYALDAGLSTAPDLRAALVALGAETP